MRLRFPKTARLTHAAEFRRVKAQGTSFHGKLLILSVLKNPAPPETQTGVKTGLITTRRLGNAVVRNKLRRRMREIVRASLPRLAGEGKFLVVIARRDAAAASFAELRNEWLRLAKRAALLGEEC